MSVANTSSAGLSTGEGLTALAASIDAATARAAAATAAVWAELAGRRAGGFLQTADLLAIIRTLDGGKYLRPRLAATTFYGLGGRDDAVFDSVSAALQILHVGLCIHDDLIDGDELRHGRFNVAGTLRRNDSDAGTDSVAAQRQGYAAGLLAGDLALSISLRTLLNGPADPAVRMDLAAETISAVEDTIAGEWLDMRSELAPLDTGLPLTVAELKTAGYSMILPLRLGAVASGRSTPQILAALTEIGRDLGIAYQLVDDELGLFGDPARTGKSIVSDLREGKRTELIRLAYTLGSDRDRETLRRHVGDPALTDSVAADLRVLIERTGARAALREQIVAVGDRARAVTAKALPSSLGSYIVQLITRTQNRDH